jgi:hypothetical protein
VNQEELQQVAFRLSEDLRKAIDRAATTEAEDVFAIASTFEPGNAMAVNAILMGEIVQLLHERDLRSVVSSRHPATQPLFDDYLVYGRSGEFFSEIMNQLLALSGDEAAQLVTVLINMSIVGAQIPSESLISDWRHGWWETVHDRLIDEDVQGAVGATVERGDSTPDEYMAKLAVHAEEYLEVLAGLDSGLATLLRVEPSAQGLVDAFIEHYGNSRFLALRFELDRLGPDSFVEVLLALASATATLDGVAFERSEAAGSSEPMIGEPEAGVAADQLGVFKTQQLERLWKAAEQQDAAGMLELFTPDERLSAEQLAQVEAVLIAELVALVCEMELEDVVTEVRPTLHSFVHAYRRDESGPEFRMSVRRQLDMLTVESTVAIIQTLVAAQMLTDESDNDHSDRDDDAPARTVTLNDGLSMSWSDVHSCWIDHAGEEWVVDEVAPHLRVKRSLWELINPGRVPDYVAPQPPPPKRPDRKLEQPTNAGDYREREQVLRVMDKSWEAFTKQKYDKQERYSKRADSLQLSHFQRTGRWLTGVPPKKGWYPDPLGKYRLRHWQGFHWTEHVSTDGTNSTVDPDFPTDQDFQ